MDSYDEHGPYVPRERESDPECRRSPNGLHCWHKVNEYEIEGQPEGPPNYWGDVKYSPSYHVDVYRCCHCGEAKEEYR